MNSDRDIDKKRQPAQQKAKTPLLDPEEIEKIEKKIKKQEELKKLFKI
ncbi:hypothetical protein pb186bvf_000503 [Paramecium bursaria]